MVNKHPIEFNLQDQCLEASQINMLNIEMFLNYYLKHLFEQMPNIDISDQEKLDKLMPWSENIPNKCKIPNANKE